MNKNNILFIIYDLERGGPEVRLLELARHLSSDINFFICVTSNNLSMLPDFEKTNAIINVIPVSKPYLEIKKIFEFINIIRDNNINVVNVFDLKGLMIAYIIKTFSIRNLKIIYNNVNSIQSFALKNRLFLRLLGHKIDHILSNSFYSFNQIQSVFRNIGGTVVYNGVDLTKYKPDNELRKKIRSLYGFSDHDIVIGTIANFRPQKNYEFLIESFKEFSGKNSFAKLLCVGGGPLLDKIKTHTNNLGLNDKVVFTGYSNDIPALLNAMDIFVLASTHEGLPNGILQAMCARIPVISTSVGGCPELIDHMNTGILMGSNNKEEFISAISAIVNDDKFRTLLANNAKDFVDMKFGQQDMLANYLKFYQAADK